MRRGGKKFLQNGIFFEKGLAIAAKMCYNIICPTEVVQDVRQLHLSDTGV